jgi:hypothetical protein
LPILVPFDPSQLPAVAPADPQLAGGAYLTLPAEEATWVSHTITDSNSAYLPTEIHVGEITRQIVCRVLGASFRNGVTESADHAQDCVRVYVKVDHFRMAEIWAAPNERPRDSLYYSWSWVDFIVLKLFVTVRFSTPDGSTCWERAYESKPRIPHDFGPTPIPRPSYSAEVGRLFHATLAEVLQQAVIDYRESVAATQPAAIPPAAALEPNPTPPAPTAP